MGKQLKNKPLVEALLELNWKLDEVAPGVLQDPVYPIFLGRFHERMRKDYPHIEPLPAVHIPDELTPKVVKYRFRTAKDDWPVVQAGPGVATLNFTENYAWDKFAAAAHSFFANLLEAYAVEEKGPQPKFTSAQLRYINAVSYEEESKDVLKFLSTKFHTQFALPPKINSNGVVAGPAQGIQLLVSYPLMTPAGTGTVRFSTGTSHGQQALIWELNVLSTDEHAPQNDGIFKKWLNDSHDVVEQWFFALIEGELEQMFDQGTTNA